MPCDNVFCFVCFESTNNWEVARGENISSHGWAKEVAGPCVVWLLNWWGYLCKEEDNREVALEQWGPYSIRTMIGDSMAQQVPSFHPFGFQNCLRIHSCSQPPNGNNSKGLMGVYYQPQACLMWLPQYQFPASQGEAGVCGCGCGCRQLSTSTGQGYGQSTYAPTWKLMSSTLCSTPTRTLIVFLSVCLCTTVTTWGKRVKKECSRIF